MAKRKKEKKKEGKEDHRETCHRKGKRDLPAALLPSSAHLCRDND